MSPLVDCHPDRKHYALGLCERCYWTKRRQDNKEKELEKVRRWRRNNKDKVKIINLNYRTKNLPHGLSLYQLKSLLATQCGKCLICKASAALVIDHCHATGKVRGLLCNSCNLGLGFFRDSIDSLTSAIEYLSQSKQ